MDGIKTCFPANPRLRVPAQAGSLPSAPARAAKTGGSPGWRWGPPHHEGAQVIMTRARSLVHSHAAGDRQWRTSHSPAWPRRLAADLGYSYVSATDILFEILGMRPGAHPWFTL